MAIRQLSLKHETQSVARSLAVMDDNAGCLALCVADSHDRHDPVPRLAPFSGRVATAIEGRGTTTAHQLGQILQLNVEGFTAAKFFLAHARRRRRLCDILGQTS